MKSITAIFQERQWTRINHERKIVRNLIGGKRKLRWKWFENYETRRNRAPINLCVYMCVCVCVCVCVCWCVADFLALLYFLLHFVQSKICFPQTVARATVIRLAFRPRVGQYTKWCFHPHPDENESERTCYYKCPRETHRRNLNAISYFRCVCYLLNSCVGVTRLYSTYQRLWKTD